MSLDAQVTTLPRPFLKWAGGKHKLMAQYRAYFPETIQTYYEPFLGGGAVFFHLLPSQAVLSDVNPALVSVYQCLRDQVDGVISQLFIHQQHHCHKYYYQIRSWRQGTEVEQAARLIYLNKTCFNGLYRENSKGEFNVPMGRYKNPKICNPELLYAVSEAVQSADIQVKPFEAVLEQAQGSQDFVYFDPPYYPLTATSNFTAYSRYAFSELDQVRLRDVFAQLAERGVKVMLSNSDCPLIRDLYRDFNLHPILASRAINSNAKKRGKIPELLITSY